MKKMNDKTKKWLTVAGCLAICAVLVALISGQLRTETPVDAPLPSQSAQPSDVTVQAPDAEKEKEPVVVTPPEIPTETPAAEGGAVSSGTEQTIQPDPVKPEYTGEQLKDQTQTPDGAPVTTPPPVVEHEQVEQPVEPPKPDNQPQGGDVNSKGETYLPGFGWIENSGENQGVIGESDGDINKQVGIMGE